MSNNDASTSRMKIMVGAITFEIEGSETLVKEGMDYAKENILTENVREIVAKMPALGKEALVEPAAEVPRAPARDCAAVPQRIPGRHHRP